MNRRPPAFALALVDGDSAVLRARRGAGRGSPLGDRIERKVALDLQRQGLLGTAAGARVESGTGARLEPSLIGNTCESSTFAFCYDQGQRRAVYRPARAFMPAIDGLTAESVSVRRGSVVLKYSFR
jgi:hypothetical protein